MLKKQLLLAFLFLSCTRLFIASDAPHAKDKKYLAILAQASEIPKEPRPYSSILGDTESHEITLPNGTRIIIKRKRIPSNLPTTKSLPTIKYSVDERYVFMAYLPKVWVFKLEKSGYTFMSKGTLSVPDEKA